MSTFSTAEAGAFDAASEYERSADKLATLARQVLAFERDPSASIVKKRYAEHYAAHSTLQGEIRILEIAETAPIEELKLRGEL